jgi:hypothetical protein
VYLRIDTIEEVPLAEDGAPLVARGAGYAAAYAVAEDNLKLGRTVIADSGREGDTDFKISWSGFDPNGENSGLKLVTDPCISPPSPFADPLILHARQLRHSPQ